MKLSWYRNSDNDTALFTCLVESISDKKLQKFGQFPVIFIILIFSATESRLPKLLFCV